MVDPKFCPFCGGKAETFPLDKYDSYGNHERLWYVECGNCFSRSGYYNTEGEAAKTWNARTLGWIPCSERMPEKDGRYLCVWLNNSVATFWLSNKHFRLCGEIDHLVTHWMPLPEPPEN